MARVVLTSTSRGSTIFSCRRFVFSFLVTTSPWFSGVVRGWGGTNTQQPLRLLSSLSCWRRRMPPQTRRQAAFVLKQEELSVVTTKSRFFQSSATTTVLQLQSTESEEHDKDPTNNALSMKRNAAVKEEVNGSPTKRVKRSPKKLKGELAPTTPTDAKAVAKKPRSPKKSKKKAVAVSKSPPKDWESIYSLVEELREDRSAPVDTDGGEFLPQRDRGEAVWRFQILIALMLSSQTKDAVVGETMRSLQQYGLDMENIQKTSPEELNKLIGKVGFHNNKTKYIKQAVDICQDQYNGNIPPNAQELMKLPGVGPKMAYIIESVAFGVTTGIGVDTHMHRMYNQLKWVSSNNPEQTRVQLESWLPRDKWPTVNVLWVGLGQEVQQFKPKILQKALQCSRPADAMRLLKRLGVDVGKEAKKLGLEEEIKSAMKNVSVKEETNVDVRSV